MPRIDKAERCDSSIIIMTESPATPPPSGCCCTCGSMRAPTSACLLTSGWFRAAAVIQGLPASAILARSAFSRMLPDLQDVTDVVTTDRHVLQWQLQVRGPGVWKIPICMLPNLKTAADII